MRRDYLGFCPVSEPLTTSDKFLGGRLTLRQPRKGHRAGLDAALLAAAAPAAANGLALDAGAGVGSAGLALAARAPAVHVGLIEKDPAMAALARLNAEDNGLAARASVYEADLLSAAARRASGLSPEAADLVLTNPPFLDPARSRVAPAKAAAHAMPVAGAGALDMWVKACFALLRPGGTLLVIHRADALADLLAACGARGGDVRVMAVHPRADTAAVRVLARAVKGSRKPLSLRPPLVLHEADGRYRPQIDALLKGESELDWGV